MKQSRIACICLVLFGYLANAASAQKKVPGGVKVYLLSGGQRQHHGYRDQAFYLAELLENTGRFEVTLGEDAAILSDLSRIWEGEAPSEPDRKAARQEARPPGIVQHDLETSAIRKYASIIANADRRGPEFKYSKAQQQALLDFARGGGGYVSIHGANNAAPDWLPVWKASSLRGLASSLPARPNGRRPMARR